jgi:hypothetical protein
MSLLEDIKSRERTLTGGAPSTTAGDIDPLSLNEDNPLQTSMQWQYTADLIDSKDQNKLFPFSWIKVYYNSTLFVGTPKLVVEYPNNNNFDSLIAFGWNGDKDFHKGVRILSTGVDRLGRTINSTPIWDGESTFDPATQIAYVFVGGGVR